MTLSRTVGASLALAATLVVSASSQQQAPPTATYDYTYDTGPVENTGSEPDVIISFAVTHPEANSMRLFFDQVELAGDLLAGTGSILRVTSHLDGHVQELNKLHLRQWQNSTAYFNGDTVQVEIVAHPNTGANRIAMRSFVIGLPYAQWESQCGPVDDRVLSNDPRAARLLPIGCSGWLINDCRNCFLTAGHCDGGLSVAQFNVPLSNSNGSLNNPSPDDQYPIDAASLISNGGQGTGNDWAYFGTFPNNNTGLTAADAQGSVYTLVLPPPTAGNNIRITGYGTDSTPSTHNQVQQTHVGPFVTNSGSLIQYVTETTGGNSGSPVIWEETGEAIGIHTHAGCSTDGSGANQGTGSNHPGLQAALAAPAGICASGLSLPNGTPEFADVGEEIRFAVMNAGAIVPNTALVHYRYQGGMFTSIPMVDLGGGAFEAVLPPPTCQDTPEYYVSAEDPVCGLVTLPGNAPAGFFDTTVVSTQPLFTDDFETNQGWTTAVIGATSGFWQRAVPINDANWAYDPLADSDGSGQCYVTQNSAGNSDVDNGGVHLISPVFDLSAGNYSISYDYYLNMSIEDGTDRLRVRVSSTGIDGPYSLVVLHDTSGGVEWRSHVITPADLANAGVPQTSEMVFRFIANDADTQSFVEAGVDAFRIQVLECDGIGTPYCAVADNSSGSPASLSGDGSANVATNNLQLLTVDAPTNQFGYYLMSDGTGFLPNFGGSQGNLCLSSPLVRFAGNVLNSGASGEFAFTPDLTTLPGGIVVAPGETWNFQCWFRDTNPGQTSNTSNGLSVLFQ